MLKDITLGQYFPGNSVIHRLDPRTKIILTVFYVVILFTAKDFTGYAVFAAFTVFMIFTSGVPFRYILKGIKPLYFLMAFTLIVNTYMTPGTAIPYLSFWKLTATYEGLYMAILMSLRLVFLVVGMSLLTLTTSPITLTDGIESLLSPLRKIGVPAHEFAMMMTIAIRFIPTLLEETDKIIKAQSSRGADFESGNVVARAKAMIPVLVPLFISAFRRADELATAMECRCYSGGDSRTHMKQLRLGRLDVIAYFWIAALFAVILIINHIPQLFLR